MNESRKVEFYDKYRYLIHPRIKSDQFTKPLWRKLFWTTAKNSNQYKSGCVDIFKDNFTDIYSQLLKDFSPL